MAPPALYLMKVQDMAKPSLNVCAQVRPHGGARLPCSTCACLVGHDGEGGAT